jgi:hypothetical protein
MLKKDAPEGYFDGAIPKYYKIDQYENPAGIWVFHYYEPSLPFKLTRFQNEEPADVCVIRLGISRQWNQRDQKIPLYADVGGFNLWQAEHRTYDPLYDAGKDGAPTRESWVISKKSPHPETWLFTHDFYFNYATSSFMDARGKVLKGYEILDLIYRYHIKSLSSLYRLRRWIKNAIKAVVLKLVEGVMFLIRALLGFIWSIKFDPELGLPSRQRRPQLIDIFGSLAPNQEIERPASLRDFGDHSIDKPTLLGYITSIKVVGYFCLIVIIAVILIARNSNILVFISSWFPIKVFYGNIILTSVLLFGGLYVWDRFVPSALMVLYLGLRNFWEWISFKH